MDADFGVWRDKKISKDLKQWDEQDKMTCDHADPCKEVKHPDPLGAPLDYIASCNQLKLVSMTCAASIKWGSLGTFQSSLNLVSP